MYFKNGRIKEAGEKLLEAYKMAADGKAKVFRNNCLAYYKYVLGGTLEFK